MKCLSIKELVSIAQFIIAGLCLIVTLVLAYVIRFPIDLKLFALQCALTTTSIICLIFGFSTWFYNSNYKLTRKHVRVFCVTVLWILFICILVAGIHLHDQYAGDLIFKYFDKSIFDNFDFLMLQISIIMAYIIAVLMLIMNLVLTIILIRKCLKQRKSRNS